VKNSIDHLKEPKWRSGFSLATVAGLAAGISARVPPEYRWVFLHVKEHWALTLADNGIRFSMWRYIPVPKIGAKNFRSWRGLVTHTAECTVMNDVVLSPSKGAQPFSTAQHQAKIPNPTIALVGSGLK
jgi:hypothetical protein